MGDAVAQYILGIKEKATGSVSLRSGTIDTLGYNRNIEVIGGNVAVHVPDGFKVLVHGAMGDVAEQDPYRHAQSLVERLCAQAAALDATPVGFGNVVDCPGIVTETLEAIALGLTEKSREYGVAVLNGELAKLVGRIHAPATISGVMISLIPANYSQGREGVFRTSPAQQRCISNLPSQYIVFDAQGQLVIMNNDGVGTKPDLYVRNGLNARAIDDLLAMNLDDASRLGAKAQAMFALFETITPVHQAQGSMQTRLTRRAHELGLYAALQQECVGERLQGYCPADFNLNGAVVSTIDGERIRNPLRSSEGEYLVAIFGKATPRSNGLTSRRELMEKAGGKHWHLNEKLRGVYRYLTTPSTILYPVFEKLLGEGFATNVYHLSGGAWDRKLAMPLAAQGLFVDIQDLPTLPKAELYLANLDLANIPDKSASDLYAQWCMGVEGFISTADPDAALRTIESKGLHGMVVGRLEVASAENSGVRLRAYNDEQVYFSGREGK